MEGGFQGREIAALLAWHARLSLRMAGALRERAREREREREERSKKDFLRPIILLIFRLIYSTQMFPPFHHLNKLFFKRNLGFSFDIDLTQYQVLNLAFSISTSYITISST